MLSRTSEILLIVLSLLIALKVVGLPDPLGVGHVPWLVHCPGVGVPSHALAGYSVRIRMDSLTHDGKTRNPVKTTIVGIVVRVVVWAMMLLSIRAILAAGINRHDGRQSWGWRDAIALAVQTPLSDVLHPKEARDPGKAH